MPARATGAGDADSRRGGRGEERQEGQEEWPRCHSVYPGKGRKATDEMKFPLHGMEVTVSETIIMRTREADRGYLFFSCFVLYVM